MGYIDVCCTDLVAHLEQNHARAVHVHLMVVGLRRSLLRAHVQRSAHTTRHRAVGVVATSLPIPAPSQLELARRGWARLLRQHGRRRHVGDVGAHLAAEPEVANLDRLVVRDEDVGGREVAVYERVAVYVLQPVQHLHEVRPARLEAGVAPFLLQVLPHRVVAELHLDEEHRRAARRCIRRAPL